MLSLSFLVIIVFKCCFAENVITVETVLGHNAELPCNVTSEKQEDKLNILAWYRNGSSTAFYSSHDRREGASNIMSPSGRYNLVEAEDEELIKLEILNVSPSDAGLYHCVADFAASPAIRTYIQLIVIEPPQRLWVIHENGTRVATASMGSNASQNIGPFHLDETIRLYCVVFGGKPQPSLSWWTEQKKVKDTCTPLSDQRVRSYITFGPLRRADHGRVLTCFANNNEKTLPLSIDVTIDMDLPPDLVWIRVPDSKEPFKWEPVKAGETVALQCRALGAKPLPPITWRLDDSQLTNLEQNITLEPSQQLVVSDIQLTISHEYDEAKLSCCVPDYRKLNGQSEMCAKSFPLTVLYAPVLQIVVEKENENSTITVIKGSEITMTCKCQANPAVYQLTWYHEDDIVAKNNEHSETAIQPILTLTDVTEEDAGEYVCVATNDEGFTYSEPVVLDVTYPAFCEDEKVMEFGVADNECVNLTCKIKANPEATTYYWTIVSEVNGTKLQSNHSVTLATDDPVLQYQRPNGTTALIYCWGVNGVSSNELQQKRCSFLVSDETAPRPPTNCIATKSFTKEISVTCEEGHDGGIQQKFKFSVTLRKSNDQLMTIVNTEPKFMITEPKQDDYKFVIIAFNDKGNSSCVEIEKENIIDATTPDLDSISAVTNITTLALALCGGVALLALAACGLVLCAHDRTPDSPRATDPPLCAYNTDESNCETYHDSDDDSECNIRRTESFRRAMARYPSKNFDVRRTRSFHSARHLHDAHEGPKCSETRHTSCRVHSLQNLNRKRDMDALCDHLVMHLPPETSYNVPKPMNTFYTMPRKMRHKAAKEISDEVSEVTSDGFSLPPPPDEFNTYRAATRIKDVPKTTPTYSTVKRNIQTKEPSKYSNVIISPLNTVGLPTVSGQTSIYTYPDDDQVKTNPFDDEP